jgi:MFS transporter, DHA1 family, multidrug resistance protein
METRAMPAVQPRHRLGLLAVLGALSSFGPLSMDMYLPSTPTIAANLHASQALVQLTLSGCLAGLAIGQLVAGPVSDGLGRKRPLLAGLVAFTVLSVACAAAPDIGALIAFRFLQGMAGASGVVLSLAIVRDLYTGTELARVLGSLMLVFGLAPVLAPVIGGQILRFTSWRGVFGVLAAIGLVLFLLAWFLPETLPPQRRTRSRLRRLAADSRGLVRDRQYVGYTLAIALGNAALITYVSALPFIVEDTYHTSPQLFSVFFMINSIGLVTMAQVGARLVPRVPASRVVLGSLVVMAAGCSAFLAVALTGHPPLAALLVPLFFFIAFFGSMRPNATAIALTNQGAIAGTASAWVGALPFLLGAFLSPLAGLGGQGAATTAGIILTALRLGTLPCVLLIAPRPRGPAGTPGSSQKLTFPKFPPPARCPWRLAGWAP